jgi:hypothetical protein
MKIISGGQTGVDRAALDVAIERGMSWGGWCPRGGWAEDFPHPSGLLRKYPALRETPCSRPEQRTEWNVRDSDAILIIADSNGLSVSKGTRCAKECADRYGKPLLVVAVSRPDAAAQVAEWLGAQRRRFGEHMTLGVGGPRESEAPGIYASARQMLADVLDHESG